MKKLVLEAQNIHKYFDKNKALKNVNLKLYEGKVMALLGENGAGKSTLIKCISGMHKLNQGNMLINSIPKKFNSIHDSIKEGIAVVHQELQLCSNLSVAENIFLGNNKNKYLFVNFKYMYNEAKKYLEILGVHINPRNNVGNLSIADKQMVEIAKALSLGSKILILDEPTDALSKKEVSNLFDVINNLKKQKIAILYVTHRMEEVKKICDFFTVLKDGEYIKEGDVKSFSTNSIIELMIGRKLDDQFPKNNSIPKKNIMQIKKLSNQYVKNVSFDVKSGEILGISGLVGSGRTELAKTIIGYYKKNAGNILYKGDTIKKQSVKKSIKNGVFYVTEDRKKDGLFLENRIDFNIVIANLKGISNKFGLISFKKINHICQEIKEKLNIKYENEKDLVNSLSGGNQQKILLAKAIHTKPKLLILDEPTRGVDVGARKEIYKIIIDYAKKGNAVIIISSDLPEIIGISQRVIVFKQGEKVGELSNKINEKSIIQLAIQGERV